MPIYVATVENETISTAVRLLELQIPAATRVTLLRAWISPSASDPPQDEVVRVSIYGVGTPGTGGTAITETPLRAGDPATAKVAAVKTATISTYITLYTDAFHHAIGWLFVPQPDERPMFLGGGTYDNVGINFPVTPLASGNYSYGMIWEEVSA